MLTSDAPLVDIAHDLRRGRRKVTEYLGEMLDRSEAIAAVLRSLLPEAGRRDLEKDQRPHVSHAR